MSKFLINKRKLYSIVAMMLIILLYVSFISENELLLLQASISVLVMLLSLLFLFFRYKQITGGLLFYICVLVMHFGQIIILAFGMDFANALKTSIAIGSSISNSGETIYWTTLICMFFALFVCVFENNNSIFQEVESNSAMTRLSSIGWLIVGLVVVLTVVSDIVRTVQVSAMGYALGYHQNNIILYYADYLFPLCCFLLISVYKDDWKRIRFILLAIIVRDIYCAFFIGSRGEAVLDIVMCIYTISRVSCNNQIKKKIKKYFIFLCVAGIMLLPFTGLLRADRMLSFTEYIKENNPISYCLTEFGGSIVNIRLALENERALPVKDFFESFTSILPMSTTLFPNLSSTYGNAYASYLNIGFGGGLGGSVIGEAIFWFGSGIGAILYILVYVGIVIGCMNALSSNKRSISFVNNTVLLFLIYQLFYQIRGSISSFQSGIKILVYFWVIMVLFKRYLFIFENDVESSGK